MYERILLIIDAVINLALGILLLIFTEGIINFLGVPGSVSSFYPNILGAVLSGIGIALLIEVLKEGNDKKGLGILGAIAINLCGGLVLVFWLIFGNLEIPPKGYIFLSILSFILVIISIIEGIAYLKRD